MSKLSRILLIENNNPPGSAAYHRGVELARRSGAELLICHFAYDACIDYTDDHVGSSTHHDARSGYILERQRILDRARNGLQKFGLQVRTQAIWTNAPHEAVIAKAIEFNPDLVIGNLERRQDALGMYVATGEVWKLARLCPAPLMLVHEHRPLLPTRVTVAVDAEDHLADAMLNEEIISVAKLISESVGLSLDLLHVFSLEPDSRKLKESHERLLLRDQQRLQIIADEAEIPRAHCHWRAGATNRKLYEYVTDQSGELLVMGSVYRSAFSRLFLGSTTEAVIGGFPCDVVVVKSGGFLRELARHQDLKAICDEYGVVATEILDAA